MPATQRWCVLAQVISTPLRRISPASASRLPAIRLKSVVLPAPLGPMMPTASPRATARSTASAALTEPKDLERRRISRSICRRGGRAGPPVIPDGALRAKGEPRSDPGPRERDISALHEVPDSLAPAPRPGLGFRDDGCGRQAIGSILPPTGMLGAVLLSVMTMS